MQTCILLILGFIQLVFCSTLTNVTGEEAYPVCPVTLFRRKRANVEYTRWRSNMETTPEFIVKVLDEDVSTSATKQVVAINIQPVTKRGEKIIVGGAMVPLPSSATATEPRDYTRFVPPTTVPVSHLEGDMFLAPVSSSDEDTNLPIKPKGLVRNEPPYPDISPIRHALRDESPPASPQFLARSQPPFARQFAPIAQVAFNRRATVAPVPPPFSEQNNLAMPDRTTVPDTMIPLRTIPEDFPIFKPFVDENQPEDFFLSRTTLEDLVPQRTTTIGLTEITFPEEHYIATTKKVHDDEEEMKRHGMLSAQKETKTEKDSDAAYHNMFLYNDEYKEVTTKKVEKESGDSYEDRYKEHDESDLFDKEPEKVPADVIIETDNTTASEINVYPDDELIQFDDSGNDTSKTSAKRIEHIEVKAKENSLKSKRKVCSLLKLRQLNFNSPRTLPEIVAQLKQWAEDSPVARWVDITDGNLTTMENPIYMMIVDDPSSGQIISAKQTVMVIAGIQGRDHHAVAAAMYLLYQLIERSEAHTDLLTKYRFWIIPVFNPDGYDYSMTFPHKREWTKNLRQNWDKCKERDSCRACATYGLRCNMQPCYGVNLDRNFEYQWIPTEELRAEHPCGALYAGTRQLSEPETRGLTHFLHNQGTPLFTFIAFKEGDVLGVMYPYSHTRKRRAFDHVFRQRASRAASAAYSISGRPYVAGQTSEFLPLYAGGIEDWVDGHLGIDNTYTIMIFRPTDSYNSRLITERVVHEAYAAMDTLLLQSVEPLGPPVITHQARSKSASISPIHVTLLFPSLTIIFCS